MSTSYDDKLRGEWASLLYNEAERVITYTLTQPSVWDFKSSVFKSEGQFPSMRPLRVIPHNCQTVRLTFPSLSSRALLSNPRCPLSSPFPPTSTMLTRPQGRWLTPLRARWTENPDVYPHFTIGNMHHSLDIFSAKGDLLARLEDKTK